MKIYLDNCCYNRPYDDQSQLAISIESQAKIRIQEEIIDGTHELVSSYVIRFENSQNPFQNRRASTTSFIENYTSEYVGSEKKDIIGNIANEVMSTGIKTYDAMHVACAIYAKCDYLITTDKRLLKYASDDITIINPVDFIRLEVNENE